MKIENGLKISALPVGNKTVECSGIIQWAEMWDWGVGKIVANRLEQNAFNALDTIFAMTIDEQYVGFCILEEKDDWATGLDLFTPFITAVYVDPKFRGQHLSEKLLDAACDFARSLGFNAVYLISNHQGFYEKFGFEKFTQTVTLSGETEPVYKRCL